MTTRRLSAVLLVFGLAMAGAWAADDTSPAGMPAVEFLARARQPFHNNAWGRFRGTVQHRTAEGTRKMDIALDILLDREYLRAQLVFAPDVVYRVTQAHGAAGLPTIHFEIMPPEDKSPLKDLGLRMEDVTLFVLYWDFIEELPGESVRGQTCRVMRLRNPQTFETVRVFLSAEYVAPLRVEFFRPEETEANRVMEFTDFERQGDLWYLKSVRIEGKDWKTQIKFTEAEIAASDQTPPPENLFAH